MSFTGKLFTVSTIKNKCLFEVKYATISRICKPLISAFFLKFFCIFFTIYSNVVANIALSCYKLCMRCGSDTPFRKEWICIQDTILFGKYKIISKLGAGSSGVVYLAEHLKLKLYRAIKCIPKGAALTASLYSEDGFPAEAVLLKNLRHPGIPFIYDIDEDNSFIYMIEEYIQGDSLDVYLSCQDHFTEESAVEFCIQLCDILDYLHHLSPYPILYQDLKPEHIIVCGNQIKLIDFGIASFISDSSKQFQYYGTAGFAAPEALAGSPVSTGCDIYSVGKILQYMSDITGIRYSDSLAEIVAKATAYSATKRFETAADLRNALFRIRPAAQKQYPHLIRNIFVAGCKPGAGATHIAVSFVSALNKQGISSIYIADEQTDRFDSLTAYHTSLKEKDGIYRDKYFYGIPAYGLNVQDPLPSDAIRIKDCGCLNAKSIYQCDTADLMCIILCGSDWDMSDTLSFAQQIKVKKNITFICNYGNRQAARRISKLLQTPVYCFPCGNNPYRSTTEVERLVSVITKQKGERNKFFTLIKKGNAPAQPLA